MDESPAVAIVFRQPAKLAVKMLDQCLRLIGCSRWSACNVPPYFYDFSVKEYRVRGSRQHTLSRFCPGHLKLDKIGFVYGQPMTSKVDWGGIFFSLLCGLQNYCIATAKKKTPEIRCVCEIASIMCSPAVLTHCDLRTLKAIHANTG